VFPVVLHEVSAIVGRSGFAISLVPVVHAANQNALAAGTVSMVSAAVIGMTSAFVVWMAGQALEVLVLLSPFPLLDLLLKAFRVAIFLIIGMLTMLNSKAGMVFSALVILVCLMCFWWALRLVVFGTIFAWDLLRARVFGHRPSRPGEEELLAASGSGLPGLRKRSLGVLRTTADGTLEFVYRPLMVGFRRVARFERAETYDLGRGFFFPSLLAPTKDGNFRVLFRLLPRYTGFEEEILSVLRLRAVRDVRIPSEVRTAWHWLRGTVARREVA
jgi:hypothetical protein